MLTKSDLLFVLKDHVSILKTKHVKLILDSNITKIKRKATCINFILNDGEFIRIFHDDTFVYYNDGSGYWNLNNEYSYNIYIKRLNANKK